MTTPDYGQSRFVVDYVRRILRGHVAPDDQVEAAKLIMFYVNECYATPKRSWSWSWTSNYAIQSARVIGPGYIQDNDYITSRITVVCERTQDGLAVVTDACIG